MLSTASSIRATPKPAPAVKAPAPAPALVTDDQKIVYAVGILLQRSLSELDLTPANYKITRELLYTKAKSDAILLHSLPRMDEIPTDVDITKWSRYWQEAFNGVVEEIDDSREDLVRVQARAWVEAESQKGILIGSQGRMIKAIGTAARRELERQLGVQVHLDLAVRVRRGWRGDDGLLDRLGIE